MLGYGSGGTVVLQGRLDGRPVAVKRLLARFAELARTEINALIHTDDHPNVVGAHRSPPRYLAASPALQATMSLWACQLGRAVKAAPELLWAGCSRCSRPLFSLNTARIQQHAVSFCRCNRGS